MDDSSHDDFGNAILGELESATRFSTWMYETVEPFLGDIILEIGSGIGNISRQLPVRTLLSLSDSGEHYTLDLCLANNHPHRYH